MMAIPNTVYADNEMEMPPEDPIIPEYIVVSSYISKDVTAAFHFSEVNGDLSVKYHVSGYVYRRSDTNAIIDHDLSYSPVSYSFSGGSPGGGAVVYYTGYNAYLSSSSLYTQVQITFYYGTFTATNQWSSGVLTEHY